MQLCNRYQSRTHAANSFPARIPGQSIYHVRWRGSSRRNTHASASAEQAPVEAASPSVISSRHGNLTWASCVSSKPSVKAAVQEAVDSIQEKQPDSFKADLAVVFASCNYGSQLQDVVAAVRRQVPSVRHIFGCSAFGVLGSSPDGAVEVEGEPGISLTLAALPGVDVSVMHMLRSSIPSEDASPEAWSDLVGMSPLEQLQQSQPPSAMATADDSDEDDSSSSSSDAAAGAEAWQQQPPDQQQPATPAAVEQPSSNQPLSVASSAAASAQQQQQQQDAVSFLVLCDPRFQQSKQLLAGLDFAFPSSNKVGAVLSQGQQNKRRLMFVWSADGPVQTGTAAWQRKQQQRRQKQQQLAASSRSSSPHHQLAQQAAAADAVAVMPQQPEQRQQQQQESSGSSSSNAKKKGLFGSLFDSLLSGLNDEDQQQQPSSSSSSKQQAAAASGATLPSEYEVISSKSESNSESDDDEDPDDSNGVFMYGAAVLAMKGPLVLEPVTCQGYRTVSDKVWTIGQTSRDGDLIATLIDPDSEGGEEDGEVVPLIAVYELMMAAGFEEQLGASPEEWIEQLSSSLAVAIAADSWRPASELQQDDFQVCAISEVWQKTGYIRIDGQARPGYRLRLVLRDELGIRDDLSNKLLGLKRAELAGVLSGKKQPAPLGAFLFSDIGRGSSLYDTPNYESGAVSKFLPVPLAGMFGSAQISSVNKKAALYELASAIGVVRPLTDGSTGSQTVDTASELKQ